MRNLDATFTYTINGSEEKEFNTDLTGSENEQEIREAIAEAQTEQLQEQGPEEEKEYSADDVELTGVTSSEDVHEKYLSLERIFDYADYFCECDHEAEVVNAAIDCDIQGCDIDEAYQGAYKDNEDFAQETADQLGAVDKNAAWPINCIDWEYAAKELMYDYCESNGHYFRNM